MEALRRTLNSPLGDRSPNKAISPKEVRQPSLKLPQNSNMEYNRNAAEPMHKKAKSKSNLIGGSSGGLNRAFKMARNN